MIRRLVSGLACALLAGLCLFPLAAHAQSPIRHAPLTWTAVTQHLDAATASHVVRSVRHVYGIWHPTGTADGTWTRVRQVSPHVRVETVYPRYIHTAPTPTHPSGPWVTVTTTGYDDVGTTASGLPSGYGRVAVDPSVFPLGTRFWIPSYGYAVAADTGGAVRGYHLDLWFATASQCYAWTGTRSVEVLR